jgi:hypothetical protein
MSASVNNLAAQMIRPSLKLVVEGYRETSQGEGAYNRFRLSTKIGTTNERVEELFRSVGQMLVEELITSSLEEDDNEIFNNITTSFDRFSRVLEERKFTKVNSYVNSLQRKLFQRGFIKKMKIGEAIKYRRDFDFKDVNVPFKGKGEELETAFQKKDREETTAIFMAKEEESYEEAHSYLVKSLGEEFAERASEELREAYPKPLKEVMTSKKKKKVKVKEKRRLKTLRRKEAIKEKAEKESKTIGGLKGGGTDPNSPDSTCTTGDSSFSRLSLEGLSEDYSTSDSESDCLSEAPFSPRKEEPQIFRTAFDFKDSLERG